MLLIYFSRKISGMPRGNRSRNRSRPSRFWYLLPIFLGVVGAVIGYFFLKDRDREFAEKLLKIGLVMIVVYFVLTILLAAFAYIFISSVMGPV